VLCGNCATSLPKDSQFCLKCGEPVTGSSDATDPPITEVDLGCAKCGASLPQGAQFCLKCGKPVSVGGKPASGVTLEASAPPPRPRPRPRVFPWLLLGLFLIAIVWTVTSDNPFAQGLQEVVGWKHDHTVLDNPFSVSAHSFRYYKFALPEGSLNVAIVGQFSASADADASRRNKGRDEKDKKDKDTAGDNMIEVFVLSEPAFTVWQNGYATSAVYESGRVSQGNVQAELPAGAGIYYLVFNNKFSPKTAKNIDATVLLRYKSWLPDWFRRIKGRVWNWLGL
jgi:ribosomal protein L40E